MKRKETTKRRAFLRDMCPWIIPLNRETFQQEATRPASPAPVTATHRVIKEKVVLFVQFLVHEDLVRFRHFLFLGGPRRIATEMDIRPWTAERVPQRQRGKVEQNVITLP